MATITDQISNINKTISGINELTTGGQQKLTPLKPITPESITDNVQVIDTNVSTGVADKNLQVPTTTTPETTQDAYIQALAQQEAQARSEKESSFASYVDTILNAPTESQIQAEQYKTQGVDEKQLLVDQYQTELIKEQDALRTEKERILSQGGGLKSGAQAEIANAERESYAKQADIALLQLAAQDQLDYATRVADRAVDAMYSQQEKINSVLSLIYQESKDQWTTDEQRLFETKQAERERQLDWDKEMSLLTINTKADAMKMAQLNGAPQSVIDAIARAKDTFEVIDVAGQWGSVDLLQRSMLSQQILTEQVRRKQLQAEIDAITNPITGITEPSERFDAETKLADKFDGRAGDFKSARTQIANIDRSYQLAIDAAKDQKSINAASQGVLVAFQKLLDPTSVVRESEYARSGEGLALANRIDGYITKIKSGGAGLTAEDLKEFVTTANTFLEGYQDTAIDEANLIAKQAYAYGLNVENILPESMLNLMEEKAREALENLSEGETVVIGKTIYRKVNGELIEQ